MRGVRIAFPTIPLWVRNIIHVGDQLPTFPVSPTASKPTFATAGTRLPPLGSVADRALPEARSTTLPSSHYHPVPLNSRYRIPFSQ